MDTITILGDLGRGPTGSGMIISGVLELKGRGFSRDLSAGLRLEQLKLRGSLQANSGERAVKSAGVFCFATPWHSPWMAGKEAGNQARG